MAVSKWWKPNNLKWIEINEQTVARACVFFSF